jgi:hypothetical protein
LHPRSKVAPCNELWGERQIRVLKEVVHGRVTHRAEIMFANAVCQEHALAVMAVKTPDLVNVGDTIKEEAGKPCGKREGPQWDGGSSTAQLMGSGKLPTADASTDLRTFLDTAIRDMQPAGWGPGDAAAALAGGHVRMYGSADIRAEELLRTEEAFTGLFRQNCWVVVHWMVAGEEKPHICACTHFVGARHPTNEDAEELRLAGVRVYKPQPRVEGMYVAVGNQIDEKWYPVALDGIDSTLVIAHPGREFNAEATGKLYGIPFLNCSKSY